MQRPVILIVEDEPGIADTLQYALRTEGFEPRWCAAGEAALTQADDAALVILDVGLPDISGFEVFKRLRAREPTLPILFLTARADEIDRVVGLELGADDYVTKPFSLRELLARVKAMLRRRERPAAAGVQQFVLGGARIDLAAFTVERDGVVHTLSPKEAGMLSLLRQHGGRAVSRAKFLSEVWGGDQFVGDRTIDTHMLNLRQKVELDSKTPRFLLTVHGVGYRLVEHPEGSES